MLAATDRERAIASDKERAIASDEGYGGVGWSGSDFARLEGRGQSMYLRTV
jgi:hypothetical protein